MHNHSESSPFAAEVVAREKLIRKSAELIRDRVPAFPARISALVAKVAEKDGYSFDTNDIEMDATRTYVREECGGVLPEYLYARVKELLAEDLVNTLAEQDPESDPTAYFTVFHHMLTDPLYSFLSGTEAKHLEDAIYARADEMRKKMRGNEV